MKVLIISDKDEKSEAAIDLLSGLTTLFSNMQYESRTIEVGRDNLAACLGCFGCWIKTPGECIINDLMSDINKSYMNSDLVIYLSPIVFGQLSANVKNTLDRCIPNVLPFFQKTAGGIKHPLRYEKYPQQMIIGYGDDLTEEEKSTFVDITGKHKKQIKHTFICTTKEKNSELIKTIAKAI